MNDGDCIDCLREEKAGILAKYNELVFAVWRCFPGESQHDTALRYIRERENRKGEGSKQAMTLGRERRSCETCRYGAIEPDGVCHYNSGQDDWAGEISGKYVCKYYVRVSKSELEAEKRREREWYSTS